MMRWISLINKLFSDISISQGSVATRLRCGEIFNECCIANFFVDYNSERIVKIGQYLTKLYVEHLGFTFFWPTLYIHDKGTGLKQQTGLLRTYSAYKTRCKPIESHQACHIDCRLSSQTAGLAIKDRSKTIKYAIN